jgi:hypothetical protein
VDALTVPVRHPLRGHARVEVGKAPRVGALLLAIGIGLVSIPVHAEHLAPRRRR